MLLTAVLPPPEGGVVALNAQTNTATQGESIEQALANLRETTELYLDEFPLSVACRAEVMNARKEQRQ